jgi:hypothetical protein
MLRNHRLACAGAAAGMTLGAALLAPGVSSAAARPAARTLPVAHQTTPAETGLGPLLQELSQVNGIKGTALGDALSSYATNFSNEDGIVWQNEIDGLHKLQTESASYPAPFNTLFYNLATALLNYAESSTPAGSSTPAVSSQRAATATSPLSVKTIL